MNSTQAEVIKPSFHNEIVTTNPDGPSARQEWHNTFNTSEILAGITPKLWISTFVTLLLLVSPLMYYNAEIRYNKLILPALAITCAFGYFGTKISKSGQIKDDYIRYSFVITYSLWIFLFFSIFISSNSMLSLLGAGACIAVSWSQGGLFFSRPSFPIVSAAYLFGAFTAIFGAIAQGIIIPLEKFGLIPLCLLFEQVAGHMSNGTQALLREKERRLMSDAAVKAAMLADNSRHMKSMKNAFEYFISARHDLKNQAFVLNMLVPELNSALMERDIPLLEDHINTLNCVNDSLMSASKKSFDMSFDSLMDKSTIQIDLHTSINKAIDQINGATIFTDVPEDTILDFVGTEDQFESIIKNLTINAIQGNGIKGASKIDIKAFVLDFKNVSETIISVSDNGPGFPEIFTGGSITPGLTLKESGSGVGLFTVKKLMIANSGDISISNTDIGAMVELVFPHKLSDE